MTNFKQKCAWFARKVLPPKVLREVKKLYYAFLLKNYSEGKEADFQIVKKLVATGQYVVDVGANVGVYANFLSKIVGPEGKVFSIEPIPGTCEILKSNVKKLRLANVKVFCCAVSDTCGKAVMETPCYQGGTENIYESKIVADNTGSSAPRFEVELRSLDSLFAGLDRKISFIKCDVEGHELNVLKGAMRIIADFKPSWLIEISGDPDDANSSAFRTFHFMEERGYQAFWFDGLVLNKRKKGDRSTNYFFLNSSVL